MREDVRRSTKEEQTLIVLLDLTRLSVWLHYYYNIYLIEKKGQPKLTGRGSDTM